MANKAELVDRVAKKTQLTKKDVSAVVDALFETIKAILSFMTLLLSFPIVLV